MIALALQRWGLHRRIAVRAGFRLNLISILLVTLFSSWIMRVFGGS